MVALKRVLLSPVSCLVVIVLFQSRGELKVLRPESGVRLPLLRSAWRSELETPDRA